MQIEPLEQNVLAAIGRHNLIQFGDTVIVALSGGADSMALLWVLWQNKEQLGITVQAAHVNHGLRDASQQEEQFVTEFCQMHGIVLHLHRQERQKKQRSEEWARNLRYDFFAQLIRQQKEKPTKIATAHTLTDQAETLLFRLARGTGPKGAGGIPVQRDCFIRPLLTCTRNEVEAYCSANGLDYVQDESNFTDRYARNRIRLHVLPQLEQINPQVQQALGQFCNHMQSWQKYFDRQGENLLKEAKTPDGWNAEILQAADAVIRAEALRRLAESKRPLRQQDLPKLEQLVQGECKVVQLGPGLRLINQNGILQWKQKTQPLQPLAPQRAVPGTYHLPGGYCLVLSVLEGLDCEQIKKFPQSRKKGLTNWADYDKIVDSLSLRTRQPGDVFRPVGRGGSKTLKKLFNEKGVPLQQRALLPLLAVDSQVVWLWGEGTSEAFLPSQDTKRILLVNVSQDSIKESET